jgi:hypothetical protein
VGDDERAGSRGVGAGGAESCGGVTVGLSHGRATGGPVPLARPRLSADNTSATMTKMMI